MLNELLGAVLQIAVFTLIPFLVFLIQHKSAKGFFDYIGLKRSTQKANLYAAGVSLLFFAPMLVLTLTDPSFRAIMFEPSSITGKFRQMEFGIHAALLIVIMAVFKTALAEEILFRGFIAKRLMGWLGYQKGNLLQAIIFGAIHTGLFAMTTTDVLFLTVIFVFPAAGAYISAYLNEKLANGSIIPGWISHGLANVLAYSIVGFAI